MWRPLPPEQAIQAAVGSAFSPLTPNASREFRLAVLRDAAYRLGQFVGSGAFYGPAAAQYLRTLARDYLRLKLNSPTERAIQEGLWAGRWTPLPFGEWRPAGGRPHAAAGPQPASDPDLPPTLPPAAARPQPQP